MLRNLLCIFKKVQTKKFKLFLLEGYKKTMIYNKNRIQVFFKFSNFIMQKEAFFIYANISLRDF